MMNVSYDVFTESFLSKITEYNFINLSEQNRTMIVDGYMKRSCAQFASICKLNIAIGDDNIREFTLDIKIDELVELVDIVSEGMLVQWMKPYVYNQEILENMLNTSDFSAYSPAELLHRITTAYNMCKKDFVKMMREYSYIHGDLSDLHI